MWTRSKLPSYWIPVGRFAFDGRFVGSVICSANVAQRTDTETAGGQANTEAALSPIELRTFLGQEIGHEHPRCPPEFPLVASVAERSHGLQMRLATVVIVDLLYSEFTLVQPDPLPGVT